MKKIRKIQLAILALLITTSSCTEFLDLPPSNQRAVSSFTDVKTVFAGYLQAFGRKGYAVNIAYSGGNPSYGTPLFEPEDVMMFEAYSDNIDFENAMPTYLDYRNYDVQSDRNKYYGDLFLYNNYSRPTELWNKYYAIIGFLNGMEDRLGKFDDGPEDERNQLYAELYIHRAFHFFKLLQWFAPYQNEALGIPVYLNTGEKVVGVKNPRKPQSEVYQVILEDLHKALEIREYTKPGSINQWFNTRYIHNLLAQIYWFKAESAAGEEGDYANAKKYAELAIENTAEFIPTTRDGLIDVWNNWDIDYPAFFNRSREYGGMAPVYGTTQVTFGYHPVNIPMQPDFVALFDDTDLRKKVFFQPDGKTLSLEIIDGSIRGGRKLKYYIFSPENAYLILAEAKYRLGDTPGAIEILNEFKGFRSATPVSGLSGDDLLNEIINERRREFFANKDMRWLDLKRYANKTISRIIGVYGESYEVTVEPHNFRYALPIPIVELRENPDMIPNAGWTLIEF